MLVNSNSDFVDFNFQIFDNFFFSNSSDKEVSIVQKSKVFFDLIEKGFFSAVDLVFQSNGT